MFLSSVIPVVVWTTQVVARHVSESLCDFEICGRFDHFFSKQTSVSRKNNCFRWRVFDLPQSRGSPPPPLSTARVWYLESSRVNLWPNDLCFQLPVWLRYVASWGQLSWILGLAAAGEKWICSSVILVSVFCYIIGICAGCLRSVSV